MIISSCFGNFMDISVFELVIKNKHLWILYAKHGDIMVLCICHAKTDERGNGAIGANSKIHYHACAKRKIKQRKNRNFSCLVFVSKVRKSGTNKNTFERQNICKHNLVSPTVSIDMAIFTK